MKAWKEMPSNYQNKATHIYESIFITRSLKKSLNIHFLLLLSIVLWIFGNRFHVVQLASNKDHNISLDINMGWKKLDLLLSSIHFVFFATC